MSQEFYKIIETLPTETGVYYLYGKDNQLLYIGKSKNIRKRVSSHLTSKTAKAKKIQQQLVRVAFEKTGCEFIALLKEQHEIKVNQPLSITLQSIAYSLWVYVLKKISMDTIN